MTEYIKSAHKRIKKLKARLKRARGRERQLKVALEALARIKHYEIYRYEGESDGYADCKSIADMALWEIKEIREQK